jgi:hypothetical protein
MVVLAMTHKCITFVLGLPHLCIIAVSARGPLGHGDGGGPSWHAIWPFLGVFAGRWRPPLTLKSGHTHYAPLRGALRCSQRVDAQIKLQT